MLAWKLARRRFYSQAFIKAWELIETWVIGDESPTWRGKHGFHCRVFLKKAGKTSIVIVGMIFLGLILSY